MPGRAASSMRAARSRTPIVAAAGASGNSAPSGRRALDWYPPPLVASCNGVSGREVCSDDAAADVPTRSHWRHPRPDAVVESRPALRWQAARPVSPTREIGGWYFMAPASVTPPPLTRAPARRCGCADRRGAAIRTRTAGGAVRSVRRRNLAGNRWRSLPSPAKSRRCEAPGRIEAPCGFRLVFPRLDLIHAPSEWWPSGRRHTPAKGADRKRSRGFESLPLRHLPSRKRSPDPAAAGFFRCFRGLCGRG